RGTQSRLHDWADVVGRSVRDDTRAAALNAGSELGVARASSLRIADVGSPFFFAERYDPGRISTQENAPSGGLGVPQHAVNGLELGAARSGGAGDCWECCLQHVGVELFRRRPAVTLADEADEIRPATVDFGEADRKRCAAFGLFLGDAPAQVYLEQFNPARTETSTQRRKRLAHQDIALTLHIEESGRYKHAYSAVLFPIHFPGSSTGRDLAYPTGGFHQPGHGDLSLRNACSLQ